MNEDGDDDNNRNDVNDDRTQVDNMINEGIRRDKKMNIEIEINTKVIMMMNERMKENR